MQLLISFTMLNLSFLTGSVMFSFVADESLLTQNETAVCLFAGTFSGLVVQIFIGFIVDRFKGFLFVYRLFSVI